MNYNFEIMIGDWSGDGHGHDVSFQFEANKPIDEVREAYFRAREMFPERWCPEKICQTYQYIDSSLWAELAKGGCPLPELQEESETEKYYLDPEDMARMVAWFCMQGDPALILKELPVCKLPALQFYGYDKKNRHISHIGYGLFL